MEVANIHLLGGDNHNAPKMIALHAMAEYIHVNSAVKEYYAAKGKVLELGRDYHAPEWLRALGYSAHDLVTPSGLVIKCRENHEGAYHAYGYNTDSLGVEFLLEGIHTYETFKAGISSEYLTSMQFGKGVEIVTKWMIDYDIPIEKVVTHHSLSPNRKTDPGTGFPLSQFKLALQR